MISIKKHIPNSITCLNLLCGCLACMFAFKGYANAQYVYLAGMLICAGAIFDFMDGFVANVTRRPINIHTNTLLINLLFILPPINTISLFSEKIIF